MKAEDRRQLDEDSNEIGKNETTQRAVPVVFGGIMKNRVYQFDNTTIRHVDYEMLYEKLIDRTETLFQIIDASHVKYAWGLNTEEQAFYFCVFDARLYYDDERNEYACASANRFDLMPFPDISYLLRNIDYFDVNSDIFQYYSMNLNGGSPRQYHLIKRLKTDVRLVKIRVEDISKAYDLICRL